MTGWEWCGKPCVPDLSEEKVITEPLIYCHFAKGIGEPKYMPITEWDYLHKLLADALKGYNELNAEAAKYLAEGLKENKGLTALECARL